MERYAKSRYRSLDQRWLNKREKNLVAEIFREHSLSGTILDIPVGYGRFVPLLRSFGTLFAADIGIFPLLYERQQVGLARGCVNCAAENLPLADNSVDLVFCFRLLQHQHEEGERVRVLKEFQRVSRRWIVMSVYLSSRAHKLHRAVVRNPSRITMLTPGQFDREVRKTDLTLVKQVSVLPGLHAQRICLLSTGQSS